jgi:hypothetical protein
MAGPGGVSATSLSKAAGAALKFTKNGDAPREISDFKQVGRRGCRHVGKSAAFAFRLG